MLPDAIEAKYSNAQRRLRHEVTETAAGKRTGTKGLGAP